MIVDACAPLSGGNMGYTILSRYEKAAGEREWFVRRPLLPASVLCMKECQIVIISLYALS